MVAAQAGEVRPFPAKLIRNGRQQVLSEFRKGSAQILQRRLCCLETMNVAFKDSHVETCVTSHGREQHPPSSYGIIQARTFRRLSCQHLADTTHPCTPSPHTTHGVFDVTSQAGCLLKQEKTFVFFGQVLLAPVKAPVDKSDRRIHTSKCSPGSFCQEAGMTPSPFNSLTSARQQPAYPSVALMQLISSDSCVPYARYGRDASFVLNCSAAVGRCSQCGIPEGV